LAKKIGSFTISPANNPVLSLWIAHL
jgi:hypothetical protein